MTPPMMHRTSDMMHVTIPDITAAET